MLVAQHHCFQNYWGAQAPLLPEPLLPMGLTLAMCHFNENVFRESSRLWTDHCTPTSSTQNTNLETKLYMKWLFHLLITGTCIYLYIFEYKLHKIRVQCLQKIFLVYRLIFVKGKLQIIHRLIKGRGNFYQRWFLSISPKFSHSLHIVVCIVKFCM